MINPDSPLIFTHIPKTGGMSIFASMGEQYGMTIADMYDISLRDNNWKLVEELLTDDSKSVYTGHYPFGLHEWFTRPCYYFGMVRKPVDRVVSLYLYSIQFRNVIHQTLQETGLSLDDLFERRMVADFYKDFSPWITGDESLALFLKCGSKELQNGMVRRYSGIGMDELPPGKEALNLAKENITRYYAMVGIQERYQDTLKLLRAKFAINATEYHVNKGPDAKKSGTKKINITLRKRIKEMNKLDTELYSWVTEHFDQQLLNPSPPVAVTGGGKVDFENAKLWHAIGSSPMRVSAMEKGQSLQEAT